MGQFEKRRIVACLDPRLGGNAAYSDLPASYQGPTKMLYDGRAAIFPTQSEAINAAQAAIQPDLGGYSNVVLVAVEPDEAVTHCLVEDWIFG